MKTTLNNILLPIFITAISIFLASCSEDEVKIDPKAGLVKVTEGNIADAGARVEIWSRENFVSGLNQIFLAIYDSETGREITNSEIELYPLMDMHTMSHSCPVLQPKQEADNTLFPAEIMFTMPSGEMGSWTLEVTLTNPIANKNGTGTFEITVNSTTPSRMISFQASSGQRYYLSYVFPEGMKVGVNDFDVIAYTLSGHDYVPAEDLTIVFTPEMPSMDHGSPNNANPVYDTEGHYRGKANFTMTGEWRLNLQLLKGDTELGTKYFDVVVN